MRRCGPYRWLIDRWFTGAPDRWVWRLVQHHTSTCTACRAYYDRLAVVRRAMSGQGAVPAEVLDLIGADVLARSRPPGPKPARVLVAIGCTLAVAVVASRVRPTSMTTDTCQARSLDHRKGESIRLFCLSKAGVVQGSASEGGRLQCPQSGLVQVTYSSSDAPGRFLAVVGLDAARGVHAYHAPSGGGSSVPLIPGSVDEVLSRSVRLSVNHPIGAVQVRAFVSARPLASDELAHEVLATDPGGDPPRIILEVVPG